MRGVLTDRHGLLEPGQSSVPVQADIRPRTELSREKTVYKYLHAWANLHRPNTLYRLAFPHQDEPLPSPQAAGDTALTAFAQLCTLRLRVKRCLVTLVSSGSEYVLAEATRSMSLQYRTFDDKDDGLWLGCCSFPRADGINDLALDRWRKARRYRDLPKDADHYYAEGCADHWLISSDVSSDTEYNSRVIARRAAKLRFFASIPLRDADGCVIGALSILDDRPQYGVSAGDMLFLEEIADTITNHLDTAIVRAQQQRSERLIQALGSFNGQKSSIQEWWIEQDDQRLRNPGRYSDDKASSVHQKARLAHEFGEQSDSDTSITARRRIRREESEESEPLAHMPAPTSPTTGNNLNAATAREAQDIAAVDLDRRPDRKPASQSDFAHQELPQPVDQNGNPQHRDNQRRTHKSAPSGLNPALDVQHTYARASNLLCEAMHVEGVVFVDATAASAALSRGGSAASRNHDSMGDHSNEGPTNSVSEDNASDEACAAALCRIIGFATRSRSTLTSSSSSRQLALGDNELRSFIRRYPRGKVFNFADAGVYSSSGEDPASGFSENEGGQNPGPRRLRKTRTSRDAARLGKIMTGAKTIAFLPMWDDDAETFASACFTWSTTPLRFFTEAHDISYISIFGHSLMAELARLNAIASDQAKGKFISSISHELRSPLHGVLAGTELLQETDLTAFQQEMVLGVSLAGRTLLDTYAPRDHPCVRDIAD